MIKLSLPGFYAYFDYVSIFMKYYENHKELFYSDRIIDSFYDAEPTLLWRGGRLPTVKDPISMHEIIREFNNYPTVKLRHTFTNCLITEQLVNDYQCNKFVKDFIRPQDEVILNNPLLIEYFKDKYPHIPIIYSTTIGLIDINKINDLTKDHVYVLNYNYNNDNDYLAQLQHKENIEILCAEPCTPNCPYRAKHYKSISKTVLLLEDDKTDIIDCPFGIENNIFLEIQSLPHAINNNRINELAQQGFQYFKISGRTLSVPQWL